MPAKTLTPAIRPVNVPEPTLGNLSPLSDKYARRHADFKIVLFYEDLASGLRGATVLKNLAGQLELGPDADQLDTEIWKFELLLFQPEVLDQVTFRIMWADLIVVSTAGGGDLPAHVKNCLERALALKRKRDATIVALPGWKKMAARETPRASAYLRDLAQKFGLQFFMDENTSTAHSAPDHFPQTLEIEGDYTVYQELVPRDSGGRDWGIND